MTRKEEWERRRKVQLSENLPGDSGWTATVKLREPLIIINLSLPRRPESSDIKGFWIPAFAGMTFLEVALSITYQTDIFTNSFYPFPVIF